MRQSSLSRAQTNQRGHLSPTASSARPTTGATPRQTRGGSERRSQSRYEPADQDSDEMRISVESSNGVAESNRGVGSADALDTESVVHALKEVIAQAVGTNSSEQATQIASLERRAVALEKIVEQQSKMLQAESRASSVQNVPTTPQAAGSKKSRSRSSRSKTANNERTSKQASREEEFDDALLKGEGSDGSGLSSAPSALQQQAETQQAFNSSDTAGEDSVVTGLTAGDLIYLERNKDDSGSISGVVVGDVNLSTCSVEGTGTETVAGNGPWRFNESVFRVVSKLDYRARDEHRRQMANGDVKDSNKEPTASTPSQVAGIQQPLVRTSNHKSSSPSDMDLAKERSDLEARENVAALESMARGRGRTIRYGDIIQLQHWQSSYYLTLHNDAASYDRHCRRVSLQAEGTVGAHFYIRPSFKVRTIGSLVLTGDEVLLHSVQSPGVTLALGFGKSARRTMKEELKPLPSPPPSLGGFGVDLPWELVARGRRCEVNGSMEARGGFTMRLFRESAAKNETTLLTSTDYIRLSHPETGGWVQASANSDKGCILDFAEGAYEPTEGPGGALGQSLQREGGAPAHIPYVKVTPPMKGTHSAKGVWAIERLDRKTSGAVHWRSPIRLRHVASGKYLAVDSSKLATTVPHNIRSISSTNEDNADSSVEVNSPEDPNRVMYDAGLVATPDASLSPGCLGSPESTVFYLTPSEISHDDDLPKMTTTVCVEHHPPQNSQAFLTYGKSRSSRSGPFALYLSASIDELKSQLEGIPKVTVRNESSSMESAVAAAEGATDQDKICQDKTKERGLRLLFGVKPSPDDALRVVPLLDRDARALDVCLSRLATLKLYTHLTMVHAKANEVGAMLEDSVAKTCFGILHDIAKDGLVAKNGTHTSSDFLKLATFSENGLDATFTAHAPKPQVYSPSAQAMLVEVKVLDALLASALAPYSRNYGASPFRSTSRSALPARSIQMLIYYTAGEVMAKNSAAEAYIARANARVWKPPGDLHALERMSSSDAVNQTKVVSKNHERRQERWINLLVLQSEDPLGSTSLLADLVKGSATIFPTLDSSKQFLELVKDLIKIIGPQRRLLSMISALCAGGRLSTRTHQEACVRALWMNPKDRYAFGLSFHEIHGTRPADVSRVLGSVKDIPRQRSDLLRSNEAKARSDEKSQFDDADAGEYAPVVASWRPPGTREKPEEWHPNTNALWWAPEDMDLPVSGTRNPSLDNSSPDHLPWPDRPSAADVSIAIKRKKKAIASRSSWENLGLLPLVPVEWLLWPLEPENLCLKVTGRELSPELLKSHDAPLNAQNRPPKGSPRVPPNQDYQNAAESRVASEMERFNRHKLLAEYAVAQLELLADMCRGRSQLPIIHLEQSFPYATLLNLASNDKLPFCFKAACLGLVQVLYLDRFPHLVNGGAPKLPESLWVLEEMPYPGAPKSTAPVVPNRRPSLADASAFPVFSMNPTSYFANNANPILSYPDHFKFYMLRVLCEGALQSSENDQSRDDGNNKLIKGRRSILFTKAAAEETNIFVENTASEAFQRAAMTCLDELLSFGFLGTHIKLQSISKMCVEILRSKLAKENRDSKGWTSRSQVEMAKSAIDVLAEVSDLRLSYRLSKLLYNFKQKQRDPRSAQVGSAAYNYLTGFTKEAQNELKNDFEALFEKGGDDAADLDFTILGACPDIDELLMAALLQPDDKLFAKGLNLYQRTYQQRKRLAEVVQQVILLPTPNVGVFKDIHSLRVELNDLSFFLSNYSTWGVRSPLSGASFGDSEFNATMTRIDRLLSFLYNDDESTVTKRPGPDPRPCSWVFKHLDELDSANCYESEPLWEVDISVVWAPNAPDMVEYKVVPKHQDFLRSLNVQGLLKAAALGPARIDPKISYKGSNCSADEKVESQRRLIMVHKALLRLAAAFASFNRANQAELAPALPFLEDLTVPQLEFANNDSQSGKKAINPTSSIADLARAVVLSILRCNETLVERIQPSLIDTFADLANSSVDVSTCPELDLFLVACRPEGRTLSRVQDLVVEAILHPKRRHLLEGLARCLRDAVSCVGRNAPSVNACAEDTMLLNPARLLRLMRCLVENGNESAWQQLTTASGISLELLYETTVKIVGGGGRIVNSPLYEEEEESVRDATVHNLYADSVSIIFGGTETTVAGPARALNGLLAEVGLLMPPTKELLESSSLWQYIEKVALPILRHFLCFRKATRDQRTHEDAHTATKNSQEKLGTTLSDKNSTAITTGSRSLVSIDVDLVEDVLDLVENIFTELKNMTLWRDAQFLHLALISDLANTTEQLLKDRSLYPAFLKVAFKEFTAEKRKRLRRGPKQNTQGQLDNFEDEEADSSKIESMTVLEFKQVIHDFKDLSHPSGFEDIASGKSSDDVEKHLEEQQGKGRVVFPSTWITKQNHLIEIERKYPDLSALTSADEISLDMALEFSDISDSRRINFGEFVELFEALKESTLSRSKANSTSIKRGRLSRRAALCAERIVFFARRGTTKDLEIGQNQRKTPPEASTLSKHGCFTTNKSLTQAQRLIQVAPGKANLMEIDAPMPTKSLSEQLGAFQVACRHNAGIVEVVNLRRFSMVKSMQQVGRLEKKAPVKEGKSEWTLVADRLLQFITDNFLEASAAETVLQCFFVLQTHLWLARAGGRNETVQEFGDLDESMRIQYVSEQDDLNTLGLTRLLAKVLMTIGVDEGGSVPDTAVQLFIELLNGGNLRVQQTLFWYIKMRDPNVRFLEHLMSRLDGGYDGLVLCKQQQELGNSLSPRAKQHAESLVETLRFLQLLCEGHCLFFQNFLRTQPKNSSQLNLLAKAVDLFVFLVDSPQAAETFSESEDALVAQLLNFMTETMLGPCGGNQVQVTHADVLSAVNDLVSAHWRPPKDPTGKFSRSGNGFKEDSSPVLELAPGLGPEDEEVFFAAFGRDLRCRACHLIAACLEGRDDRATHLVVVHRVERTGLGRLSNELERDVRAIYARAAAKKRLPTSTERSAAEDMESALRAIETVLEVFTENDIEAAHELNSTVNRTTTSYQNEHNGSKTKREEHEDDAMPLLARVEVAWRGRTEAVVFPLPQEAPYLPQSLVATFMLDVDLTAAETRVEELLETVPVFIANMCHVYACSQKSKFYRFLHKHVASIKLVMYSFVVLLNLNVLMSPPSISHPAESAWNILKGTSALDNYEVMGLGITLFLGCVNFFGYFVIMYYIALTEVPILIQEFDLSVEANKALLKEDKFSDASAFTFWGVTLFFNLGFCGMHAVNYGAAWNLYSATVLGINLPWTLLCIRNYIIVPTNNAQRTFCIVFECAVTKPFFRNHLLLQFVSTQGFIQSEYFTLMLLDIVSNSSVLLSIIKSVTSPGASLGMVLYLFICTLVIWASFGVEHFNDMLLVPFWDEEIQKVNSESCSSTVSCFWFLLYSQMAGSGGDIRQELRVASPGGGQYLARMAYDSIFFVWVGIILMNIIAGLMLDTFGAMRENEARRKDILSSECFMCGLLRTEYTTGSFEDHQREEHDPWLYVHYVAYLLAKDPTEDTGVESFVRSQVSGNEDGAPQLDWIPKRTSVAIEAHKAKQVEAAKAVMSREDYQGNSGNADSVNVASSTLLEAISHLEAEVASMRNEFQAVAAAQKVGTSGTP